MVDLGFGVHTAPPSGADWPFGLVGSAPRAPRHPAGMTVTPHSFRHAAGFAHGGGVHPPSRAAAPGAGRGRKRGSPPETPGDSACPAACPHLMKPLKPLLTPREEGTNREVEKQKN